jgi:hypothetical protein
MLSLREKSRQKYKEKVKYKIFKGKQEFLQIYVQKEGHVLEDPKDGTFLPKKDIWSPYSPLPYGTLTNKW